MAKTLAKKTTSKSKPVKKLTKKASPSKTKAKSSSNKELDKMLATIKTAIKNKQKSVVVFTTDSTHHKAGTNPHGFGDSDLKPKYHEAYKHLLRNYDLSTRLVSYGELAVEWTVNLK